MLRDTQGEGRGLDRLNCEVDGRVAVGGEGLIHVLVAAIAARADRIDLHGEMAAHALPEVAGVGLEFAGEVPTEAAEIARGKACVEGNEALTRDGLTLIF